MAEEERLLKPAEAAKRVGVTVKTLQRWDKQGLLKAVRLVNAHRRFREGDVDAVAAGRPLPVRDDRGRIVAEGGE